MTVFQKNYSSAHIDRGWPFGGDGIEPRTRFDERTFYQNAKIALAMQGYSSAWVEVADGYERFLYLIEGGYTRSYVNDGYATTSPIKMGLCNENTCAQTSYFEGQHGFSAKFAHLPVFRLDGTWATLSAPNFWGVMRITPAASTPPTVNHLVAFATAVAKMDNSDIQELFVSDNGSAYIKNNKGEQVRFSDHPAKR